MRAFLISFHCASFSAIKVTNVIIYVSPGAKLDLAEIQRQEQKMTEEVGMHAVAVAVSELDS